MDRSLPRPGPRTERRKHRSNVAATALELALTTAAQRGNLDVVVVVDDRGLVVSNSRVDFDLEMLAAVTPIVGRGRGVPRIRRGGQQREMTVRPIEIQGEVLYVAAVGGESAARMREVRGTLAAARRILA